MNRSRIFFFPLNLSYIPHLCYLLNLCYMQVLYYLPSGGKLRDISGVRKERQWAIWILGASSSVPPKQKCSATASLISHARQLSSRDTVWSEACRLLYLFIATIALKKKKVFNLIIFLCFFFSPHFRKFKLPFVCRCFTLSHLLLLPTIENKRSFLEYTSQ